jgi:hypothetical protein
MAGKSAMADSTKWTICSVKLKMSIICRAMRTSKSVLFSTANTAIRSAQKWCDHSLDKLGSIRASSWEVYGSPSHKNADEYEINAQGRKWYSNVEFSYFNCSTGVWNKQLLHFLFYTPKALRCQIWPDKSNCQAKPVEWLWKIIVCIETNWPG